MSYKKWFTRCLNGIENDGRKAKSKGVMLISNNKPPIYFKRAMDCKEFLGYANVNQIYQAIAQAKPVYTKKREKFYVDWAL